MKKIILFLLFLSILRGAAVSHGSEEKWNTAKSTHFIAYYKNAPESFIEELINKSEDFYDRIAEALGFTRFNFWLWENRAKLYIYDDAVDYQNKAGQPRWSFGAAIPKKKTIITFPYAKDFFDTLLPHEMGHIIFREFVGFDNAAVPEWLDEGVASHQEQARYSLAYPIVKQAISSNKFIPLEKLSEINLRSTADTATVQLFYAEAICIVDYLIKEFGKDDFVGFCQYLRDKKDFKRAIASAYPFSNLEELDKAWEKYLKK